MALDRRGFLKFIGGATAGILATPVVWKGLDDVSIWSQNWSWIPRNIKGANSYVPTVSKLCPTGIGVRVRLVDGRPVRVIGNPEHPLSKGGVSSIAAAEVQMLYSPARMKRPLKRSPDGAYVMISWEEAEAMLLDGLKAAKGGDALACISGDDNGTINELLSAFVQQSGSKSFFLMPGEAQPAAKAWDLMGGEGQIGYDIEKSDFVLAIGANVLEAWGTAIRNRHAFGASHPHGAEPTAQFVYAGPVLNNTATGADDWLPIRPGTESAFALGLAHLLIKAGGIVLRSRLRRLPQSRRLLLPREGRRPDRCRREGPHSPCTGTRQGEASSGHRGFRIQPGRRRCPPSWLASPSTCCLAR